MSQDEALRLVAEVVDKSTGPLKGIRAVLHNVAREGQEHSEMLAKGMGRVEAGMKGAASAASSILSPALATVGISGLTLTATIAGIGAAMRNFGGTAKELGTLSRDTGIAASTLREVQGVLSAVGVDAGTSGQALQKFAEEARLAHRGFGPLMEFLRRQGRDEAGRAYFNNLANDIMHSKDAGDAYLKAMKGLEGIKDPIDRRIYAENVLKLGDAARLADGRLGSLADQFGRFRRNNGVVTDQDIKDAEAYARAMDGLKGTMEKLYNSVARELTPSLTDAAKAVKGFLDDQRNGVQGGLVDTIRDIKAELAKIDWAQAGKDSLAFFRETTALAGSLAKDLHTIVEAMRLLRAGDVPGALRESTGGAGTVGRLVNKFYPRPDASTSLDEQLDAQMRGQNLSADQLREHQNLRSNAPRVAEIEARQAEIRGKLDQFGLMQKGGTDSERSRQTAEDLRREMTRLTDELKRIREGGATVQQQSFDATGTGLGGLIQRASYGGGGGLSAVRQMLRGGGIYAPGGGYGGGDATLYGGPGGGAGRGPSLPGGNSPAGQVGESLRGRGGFSTSIPDSVPMTADERNKLGLIMKYEGGGKNQMNYMGKRLGLDPTTAKGYTAQGYFQMLNSNWRRIAPKLGIKTGNAMASSLEDQTRVALHLLRNGGIQNWTNYNPALRRALARGERAPAGGIPNIPSRPDFAEYLKRKTAEGVVTGQSEGEVQTDATGLRPNLKRLQEDIGINRLYQQRGWGKDDSQYEERIGGAQGRESSDPAYRPDQRISAADAWKYGPEDRADGRSFDTMYKARQEVDDQRRKALELRPAARTALQNSLRGGNVGAAQTAERALMDVRIHNPGPNTRASVMAKGSLFGDVKQVTGRQMRSSDDI